MKEGRSEAREEDTKNESKENKSELPAQFEDDRYKLRPEMEYTAGEGEYKYKTDKLGRIKHVSGTLELHPETERNNYAQLKAGKEDRHTGKEGEGKDEGGHYIGRRFGGSKELDNLFAQDSKFNKGEYKKMENEWESLLSEKDENGNQKYKIEVDIRSHYRDVRPETGKRDSQRPSDLFVYAKVTDLSTNEVVDKKIYHYQNDSETNTNVRDMKKGGK